MASEDTSPRRLVARFGGHAAAALGLELALDRDLGRWFVAACLLSGRGSEARALDAWRRLEAAGWADPAALAGAEPAEVARLLAEAGYPRGEVAVQRLRRACEGLRDQHGGSFAAVLRSSEGLEDLGARIAALAHGVGAATVLRFLRPLREHWQGAGEVPLEPAARAAAIHLGLIGEGEDLEGEPGALRAALRESSGAPPLADLEAALSRLGARACLRRRPERCPLVDCPLR